MSLEATIEILKSLSDPTRLRLVALLHHRGTLCVCELEEVLELPQYTVSRHLGILRRAGLVCAARDGARVDYRLAAHLPSAALSLLSGACCLAEDDQLRADRQAAEAVRGT